MNLRSILLALAIVLYGMMLLNLTLFQFLQPNPTINFVPFATIVECCQSGLRSILFNIVGNVVAFLPVGFFVALIARERNNLLIALLTGLFVSGGIEFLQYCSGRRTPDIDDILLNVVGSCVGYLATRPLLLFLQPNSIRTLPKPNVSVPPVSDLG